MKRKGLTDMDLMRFLARQRKHLKENMSFVAVITGSRGRGMSVSTILPMLLLLMSVAYAWNCPTHEYICELAGVEGDCCYADSNYTPGATKHHCTDNLTDCEARLATEDFHDRP